jgi:hypothetical protein
MKTFDHTAKEMNQEQLREPFAKLGDKIDWNEIGRTFGSFLDKVQEQVLHKQWLSKL